MRRPSQGKWGGSPGYHRKAARRESEQARGHTPQRSLRRGLMGDAQTQASKPATPRAAFATCLVIPESSNVSRLEDFIGLVLEASVGPKITKAVLLRLCAEDCFRQAPLHRGHASFTESHC